MRLFTLGLLALFLWPAIPAVADGTPPQAVGTRDFDLGLAEALSELGDGASPFAPDAELVAQELVGAEPLVVASLSSAAVAEMWRSSEQVSPQRSGGSGSSDRKWWKKKKWWIPIVAAVVVGVASSDGDGDDNLDDEED